MIIICEPQCKGIGHEKVNSGFICGLRLAYPQEKIAFFADITHIRAIYDILENDNVLINNFEGQPIKFNANKVFGIVGIARYYLLLKKIFNESLILKVDKIFFLSVNPIILYVIKKLKQQNRFQHISCTFVLHGGLEDVAHVDCQKLYASPIKYKTIKESFRVIIAKVIRRRKKILQLIAKKILWPFSWVCAKYSLIFKKIFRLKKIMLWQHSNHYKYIVLSPHIVKNVQDYLDTDYLNFNTIIMPIIFSKPAPPADNQFIKFAVFGYGDSAQTNKMLTILSAKQLSKSYEIRIISIDCNGIEGFSNVHCVSQEKELTRKEMENYAQDIDVFINLYDSQRYKFGCSLSIFEALSYLKPVLHLSNDGYNYFNKSEKPIGFRCDNLNDFVDKMQDMIENYSSYKNNFAVFRNNMLEYREEYDIKNNLNALRKSFTFNNN